MVVQKSHIWEDTSTGYTARRNLKELLYPLRDNLFLRDTWNHVRLFLESSSWGWQGVKIQELTNYLEYGLNKRLNAAGWLVGKAAVPRLHRQAFSHRYTCLEFRYFHIKICYSNVCNFCLTEKDTIFHFMCQYEHTKSFWVRFEMCLKEKSFNCARFSMNPTLIFSDMTEKQKQMKALTLFFCMQNSLCINADWTNLSLHLKLL